MLSPTIRIGLRQHTWSFCRNWRSLERGPLCEVLIRNRGKRLAGLCRSLRTLPRYLREGGTKGPELVAGASKAAEQINFAIAGFEVEAFRKRQRNEREHG